MIRISAIIFICLAASAPVHSQSILVDGMWTGVLAPMNHPEMHTALVYEVSTMDDRVQITLTVPGGAPVSMRDVRIEADTLRFVFNEPEEGVLLTCALGSDDRGGYAGRCSDAEGKWASFTMKPPDE